MVGYVCHATGSTSCYICHTYFRWKTFSTPGFEPSRTPLKMWPVYTCHKPLGQLKPRLVAQKVPYHLVTNFLLLLQENEFTKNEPVSFRTRFPSDPNSKVLTGRIPKGSFFVRPHKEFQLWSRKNWLPFILTPRTEFQLENCHLAETKPLVGEITLSSRDSQLVKGLFVNKNFIQDVQILLSLFKAHETQKY